MRPGETAPREYTPESYRTPECISMEHASCRSRTRCVCQCHDGRHLLRRINQSRIEYGATAPF